MSDLLKNTYTLIAGVVTVCTLGSLGGVSLYVINEGFADQREIKQEVDTLMSIQASRAEVDKYHERMIKENERDIRVNRKDIHSRQSERYEDE